jgi:hypothetical protein
MGPEAERRVQEAIKEINALDVNDPGNVFHTRQGPCRYNTCEDSRIRVAKSEKIQEAIRHQYG